MSQVFAGPYIGGLLADLGADVIKIESPSRLDQARTDYGGYFENVPGDDPWNRTSTFQVINRGKKAISLDLKSERGRHIFRELVKGADVLVENFTPRVMPGLGLGYDDLKQINPGLVMLSNSGFGATGPWGSFKAQGTTLEATMGVLRYTGYPGGAPMKAGQSYPDFLAAWTGLVALFAALVARQRDGHGQWIDLGMYELGLAAVADIVLDEQISGREYPRRGNREAGALMGDVVACAGDEAWLAYTVFNEAHLAALRETVAGGAPGADLLADVRAWAEGLDVEAAAASLRTCGIAATPVRNARDLLLDPQLRHRGFYEVVDGIPAMGPRPIIGQPFIWTGGGMEYRVRGRAPRFGEHTREVLQESGLLTPAELESAVAAGDVVLAPRSPLPAHPQDYAQMLVNRSVLSVGGDYLDTVARAVGGEGFIYSREKGSVSS